MIGADEGNAPPGRDGQILWREILGFFAAALLIRIYKGIVTPVIAEDGVVYLEQAALFGAGKTAEALRGHYPPLYPALVALARSVIPDAVWSGKAVSALFGALAVIPLAILGRATFRAAAVRAAVIVYILSPFLLTFCGDVLSESVFLFFVLLSLAAIWRAGGERRLLTAGIAGLGTGLASLARPEGVLLVPYGLVALRVLSGPREGRRSIIPKAILFVALSLFPLLPYSVILARDTGQVQFTRKGAELVGGLQRYADERGVRLSQSEGLRGVDETGLFDALGVIAGNSRLFLQKYGRDFLLLAFKAFPHAIHPIGLGLFIIGLVLRPPSSRKEWLLVAFLVWYVACIAVNYANPRFLVGMVPLAIPWCGVGIDEIHRRLSGRFRWSPERIEWIVIGVVAISLGIRAFQPERLDKLWMRDAGEILRSLEEHPRVCSRWRRLAFYAGGTHCPVPRINDYRLLLESCIDRGATHLALPRNDRTEWFLRRVDPSDLQPVFTADSVTVFRLLRRTPPPPDGR